MQSLEIRYSDVKQQTTVLAIHSLVVHAGMRFLVNAEKFITPASRSCYFFHAIFFFCCNDRHLPDESKTLKKLAFYVHIFV